MTFAGEEEEEEEEKRREEEKKKKEPQPTRLNGQNLRQQMESME